MRSRHGVVGVAALCVALALAGTACASARSGPEPDDSPAFRRMMDGREWHTENVRIILPGSYCYQDDESLCRRYGRLYTWDAAIQACRALRGGWRLPTDAEWRALARPYGGVRGESADSSRSAYETLLAGGSSGFSALLGGGRAAGAAEYARLDAHGFYWTASEDGPGTATFFNFGRGSRGLFRQPEGEKARAFSVRCVRDAT